MNLPILLGNEDNVNQPIKMLLLPDESKIYELFDFRLDGFHDLGAKPSLLLLYWLCLRVDIKPVHVNLRVQAREVLVVPNEDTYILVYKLY